MACIVLPLFFAFLWEQFFGDGQMENLPIGVVDGDNTVTSRQIIRMVKVDPKLFVSLNIMPMRQRRVLMCKRKNIYGYLSIPVGFEAKVMDSKGSGSDLLLSLCIVVECG